MADRNQIIERIKKLKTHAESAKSLGSLEEAEAFMRKVSELMEEYNLTMMEIDQAEIKSGDPYKNWGYAESISYDDKHQGWQWKMMLMDVITKFNFTNFTYKSHSKTLKVYGNMENVDMTVWLYHYLEIGLYNLSVEKYKSRLEELRKTDPEEARIFSRTMAYSYKKDFLLGAVEGFKMQLQAQRAAASTQVNSLVLYNNKMLSEFVRKTTPNLKEGKPISTSVKDYGAFKSGMTAGQNFKVNKPLSGSSTQSQKKLS